MDSASIRLLATLVGASMLLGAAGLAVAGETERVRTEVEIEAIDPDDVVFGDIRAFKPTCRRGRLVTLFHGRPGAGGVPAGTDRTNRHGDWRIADEAGGPANDYYAKAKRKVVERSGTTIVCRPDVGR